MEESDLTTLLAQTSEDQNRTGQDSPPPTTFSDVNVDEDDLGRYLIHQLKNDIADKEQMGWQEKRDYDYRSYYGIKEAWLSGYPWPDSSNFPVYITPTLLDTGKSLITDLVWRDKEKATVVRGVGKEDVRNAKNLNSVLDWQILNDIEDMRRETGTTIFKTLLNGTSYLKIIRVVDNGFRLIVENVPVERMYMPIDAKSPTIKDSDHVTQVIPLTMNDLLQRMQWGVYKNLDQVGKGWNVGGSTTEERLGFIKQEITGLDIVTKMNRDNWWIAESYVTYYPKDSMRALELIVWWAPNTGKILRKIKNPDGLRPFSDCYVYPNYGMAFHRSLPEKIRHIQEKANYTDKQVTDAADAAISPPGFYDSSSGLDPNLSVLVPTGMYPVKNVASIQWRQINIAPIIERGNHIKDLWLQAERATGFTDLYQGVNSGVTRTLGQDQMREQSADVRFSDIKREINRWWKTTVDLIYQYDDLYMPRDTKVKVLGASEFSSIDQLFNQPGTTGSGLQLKGHYDFSIANETVQDEEKEDQVKYGFADIILADPVFGQDIANRWKALDMKAEAAGIRDLEEIVKKPAQADALSPDEVIFRIMAGDQDVQPSIDVNPMEYEKRIRLWMRTGNFRESDPQIQMQFEKFLKLVIGIRIGQQLAFQNFSKQLQLGMPPAGASPGTQAAPSPAPAQPGTGAPLKLAVA